MPTFKQGKPLGKQNCRPGIIFSLLSKYMKKPSMVNCPIETCNGPCKTK